VRRKKDFTSHIVKVKQKIAANAIEANHIFTSHIVKVKPEFETIVTVAPIALYIPHS